MIDGTLEAASGEAAIAGRQVAACRLEGGTRQLPAPCELAAEVATTDAGGRFRLEELPPGTYLLLVDTGRGDFDAAVATWANRSLRPGDWPWLRDEFLDTGAGEYIEIHLPAGLPEDAALDRASYGVLTLQIGDSPFALAHSVEVSEGTAAAAPLVIDARRGDATGVSAPVVEPEPIDYAAAREAVGGLAREEAARFDRALAARWQAFIDGADSAYRDTDRRAIEAVRTGRLHAIGNAYFSAVEGYEDVLVKQPGYITIDVQSGETAILAWLDEASDDVVEARTGYQLNVRDQPGVWIEAGPEGEQLYHYGFSYYRRWEQVLPDPIIRLAEDFYTSGVSHVSRHLSDYQEAATTHRSDMLGLDWLPGTLAKMAAWQPNTPPFVHLPDSGTVDVRRQRFLDAMIRREVVVDVDSVDAFLRSEAARGGAFNQRPDRQEVIDALLVPYRSGHLFSDLEAAIILDATYGGDDEPLTIRISGGLEQGFMVPRYRDKEVLVSPDEVANVLLGYPGALNSRWAHEMAHIVDFRAPQYTFTGRPATGSRCEPVKYLMEFMWWVQRYPGDAPDWDWMPINSGLTLSRLLSDQYHNSGC